MNPIPYIVAWITGKPRYKYDVKKEVISSKFIVHSLFVMWRKIAWREYGIRAESSMRSEFDEDGTLTFTRYLFFSREAVLCYMESSLRAYIKEVVQKSRNLLRKIKWSVDDFTDIFYPQFAYSGFSTSPAVSGKGREYSFAIAGQAAQTRQLFSANTTFTSAGFDCTSADYMAVAVLNQDTENDGTDTITSVKYNTVAATQAIKSTDNNNPGSGMQFWVLHAPTVGSHTTVVVTTESQTMRFTQSAYSGVNQADTVNTSGTLQSNAVGNLVVTLVTTVDGCWTMCTYITDVTNADAYVNCSVRNGDAVSANYDLADSGASVGVAGSYTIGIHVPLLDRGEVTAIAIAPPAGAATTLISRMMRRVGT